MATMTLVDQQHSLVQVNEEPATTIRQAKPDELGVLPRILANAFLPVW
jgi:hypothetical protein